MLVSQLTYISNVLTPKLKCLEEIQNNINCYVMGIRLNSKNWINTELLYTTKHQGGMGMIRLGDFLHSLKVSWIQRYCIDQLDDHWADRIDNYFQISKDT